MVIQVCLAVITEQGLVEINCDSIFSGEPDKQLNPKKKVWEQVQPDLKTNSDRVACYKGVPFTVAGKGVVTAQTMPNSLIK